jgi:hypothetical protein
MNKSIKVVNKSFQNAVKPLVDRFAKRFPKTYKVIHTLKNGKIIFSVVFFFLIKL